MKKGLSAIRIERKFMTILIIISFVSGCGGKSVKNRAGSLYINIGHFVEKQIALLDSLRPPIDKLVRMGEEEETRQIRHVTWSHELDLLAQVDIDKPGLRGSYTVQQENPHVRVYQLKPGEKSDVQFLKLEFGKDTTQILGLEAILAQSNQLYASEKKIRARFEALPEASSRLTSYQIDGFQKLMFNDTVTFAVEAKVSY
jgi:hypothetical protein